MIRLSRSARAPFYSKSDTFMGPDNLRLLFALIKVAQLTLAGQHLSVFNQSLGHQQPTLANSFGHRPTVSVIGQHPWPTFSALGQPRSPFGQFGQHLFQSANVDQTFSKNTPCIFYLDRRLFILLFIHQNGGECENQHYE